MRRSLRHHLIEAVAAVAFGIALLVGALATLNAPETGVEGPAVGTLIAVCLLVWGGTGWLGIRSTEDTRPSVRRAPRSRVGSGAAPTPHSPSGPSRRSSTQMDSKTETARDFRPY